MEKISARVFFIALPGSGRGSAFEKINDVLCWFAAAGEDARCSAGICAVPFRAFAKRHLKTALADSKIPAAARLPPPWPRDPAFALFDDVVVDDDAPASVPMERDPAFALFDDVDDDDHHMELETPAPTPSPVRALKRQIIDLCGPESSDDDDITTNTRVEQPPQKVARTPLATSPSPPPLPMVGADEEDHMAAWIATMGGGGGDVDDASTPVVPPPPPIRRSPATIVYDEATKLARYTARVFTSLQRSDFRDGFVVQQQQQHEGDNDPETCSLRMSSGDALYHYFAMSDPVFVEQQIMQLGVGPNGFIDEHRPSAVAHPTRCDPDLVALCFNPRTYPSATSRDMYHARARVHDGVALKLVADTIVMFSVNAPFCVSFSGLTGMHANQQPSIVWSTPGPCDVTQTAAAAAEDVLSCPMGVHYVKMPATAAAITLTVTCPDASSAMVTLAAVVPRAGPPVVVYTAALMHESRIPLLDVCDAHDRQFRCVTSFVRRLTAPSPSPPPQQPQPQPQTTTATPPTLVPSVSQAAAVDSPTYALNSDRVRADMVAFATTHTVANRTAMDQEKWYRRVRATMTLGHVQERTYELRSRTLEFMSFLDPHQPDAVIVAGGFIGRVSLRKHVHAVLNTNDNILDVTRYERPPEISSAAFETLEQLVFDYDRAPLTPVERASVFKQLYAIATSFWGPIVTQLTFPPPPRYTFYRSSAGIANDQQ